MGSILDIDNFTDLAAIFPAQATAEVRKWRRENE